MAARAPIVIVNGQPQQLQSGDTLAATATGLQDATGAVSTSAAAAPTAGQVLTATDANHATWQTPSGGAGSSNWDGGQANSNYGGTIAINGGTA